MNPHEIFTSQLYLHPKIVVNSLGCETIENCISEFLFETMRNISRRLDVRHMSGVLSFIEDKETVFCQRRYLDIISCYN